MTASRTVLLAFRDSIKWEPVHPNGDTTREPRAWMFTADVGTRKAVTRVWMAGLYWFWTGDALRSETALVLAQVAIETYWLHQLEVQS